MIFFRMLFAILTNSIYILSVCHIVLDVVPALVNIVRRVTKKQVDRITDTSITKVCLDVLALVPSLSDVKTSTDVFVLLARVTAVVLSIF